MSKRRRHPRRPEDRPKQRPIARNASEVVQMMFLLSWASASAAAKERR